MRVHQKLLHRYDRVSAITLEAVRFSVFAITWGCLSQIYVLTFYELHLRTMHSD